MRLKRNTVDDSATDYVAPTASGDETESNLKIPRFSHSVVGTDGNKISNLCLFGNKPDKDMHQVMTRKLDERVIREQLLNGIVIPLTNPGF